MSGADLSGADLTGAVLTGAVLTGAVTGPLAANSTAPANLPSGYVFVNGTNQKWLVGPGADLTGADLSGVDLSGADLSGADLTGAVLTGAVTGPLPANSTAPTNLPSGYVFANGTNQKWLVGPGVDLSGADLTGAVLTGAVTGPLPANSTAPANLPSGYVFVNGTNQKWLVGPGADLTGADLSGVDLSGADLTGAVLTGTVTGPLPANSTASANLPSGYVFANGTNQKWLVGPGADLSGADLSGADLAGAVLTGAVLTNINLSDSNLKDVDFSGCNLTNCNFSNANLTGVKFDTNTNLTGVDFSYANLMIDSTSIIGVNNQLKPNSWQPRKRLYLGKSHNDYNKPAITDGFNIEVSTNVDSPGLSWTMKLTGPPPPAAASTWTLEVYSDDSPIILKDNFQFFYNLPSSLATDNISDFTEAILGSSYNKFFSSNDQRQLSLKSNSVVTIDGPGGNVADHIEENGGLPVQMKNVVVFYNLMLTGSTAKLDLKKNIAVFFKDIVGVTFISDAGVAPAVGGAPKVNYIDYYIDKSEKPYITIGDYIELENGKLPGEKTVTLISNADLSSITFNNVAVGDLSAGFNTLDLANQDATTMNVTHKEQTYTATFAPGAGSSRPWEQLHFISDDYDATGTVTISPTGASVKTGVTLTATAVKVITDDDGAITSYRYVWKAGDVEQQTTLKLVATGNADTDTYVVAPGLVDTEIICEVTTIDVNGGITTISSSDNSNQVAVTVQDTLSTFTISINDANGIAASSPLVGETLTAVISALTDPDVNTGALTVAYSWKRNNVAIVPASTSATYTVAAVDLGQILTVDVSVTQAGQTSATNSLSVTVSSATVHTYNVTVADGKFVIKTADNVHLDLNNFVLGDEYKFVDAPAAHPFRLGKVTSSSSLATTPIEFVDNKFQYAGDNVGDLYVYCQNHGFGMGSLYNVAHMDQTTTTTGFVSAINVTILSLSALPGGFVAKNGGAAAIPGPAFTLSYYSAETGGVADSNPGSVSAPRSGKESYWVSYDTSAADGSIISLPRREVQLMNKNQYKFLQKNPTVSIDAFNAIDMNNVTTISKNTVVAGKTFRRRRLQKSSGATMPAVLNSLANVFKAARTATINALVAPAPKKKRHEWKTSAKTFMKQALAAMDDGTASRIKEFDATTSELFGAKGSDERSNKWANIPENLVVMAPSTDAAVVEEICYDDLADSVTYVPLSELDDQTIQNICFTADVGVKITTTLSTFDEDVEECKYRIDIGAKNAGITVKIGGDEKAANSTTDGLAVDTIVQISYTPSGSTTQSIIKILGGDGTAQDPNPTSSVWGGGPPTITPAAAYYIGQTLTCNTDAIKAIVEGVNLVFTHTYQWKRTSGSSVVDIAGSTSQTYVMQSADVGATISCAVTTTQSAGGFTNWNSTATLAHVLPLITSVTHAAQSGQNTSVTAALSGNINAGDTFVMTKGSIVHSFTLSASAGQTSVLLAAASATASIDAFASGVYVCKIQTVGGQQASNEFTTASFADNDTLKVGDIIANSCLVGTAVTASTAGITDVDNDTLGFSYSWEVETSGVWTAIPGAISVAFTPTLAQYNKQIRVVVTTVGQSNPGSFTSQASAVGDPYVTAANGKVSKLPDQHGFYRMFEHADMFVNVEVDSKDIGEEMSQYCKTYGISHDEPEYKNHRIVTHGYWNRTVWIESEGNTFELDLFTKQMTFEQNYFKYNIVKDNFQYNDELADKTITRSLHVKWIHSRYGLQSIVIDFYANPQVMNGIRMVSGLLWSAKSTGMLVKNYKPKLMSLKRLTDNKSGKLVKKLRKTSSTLHSKPIMARGEIWTRGTTKKKIVKHRK